MSHSLEGLRKERLRLLLSSHLSCILVPTNRKGDRLMRPDGTRVKDLPPLVAAIPYIMPKRYDAQNTVT